MKNVGEIDPRCQFHQHLRAHFLYEFCRQSQNVTRKAAKKDIHKKKAREKMLMKLTPGYPEATKHFFCLFSLSITVFLNRWVARTYCWVAKTCVLVL